MKSSLSLILLIVSVAVLSAQNFEGKINYKTTFKSKLPNMSDEQFALMLGSKQEYDIKDGNYKITTNGTFLKWQTFINKENKIYTKMGNSGSLFWKDAAENSDEIISSEIKKIVTTILGHLCDELTIISKKSIEKYYFGNILKTDPALFVNHKLGHFDEVIRKANAMPLKMVINNEQFEMESVAIEILPIQFNEAMFALPAGVKTEKSQF